MKRADPSKKNQSFFKGLVRPGQTLKERTVKGGFWLFSFQITNRLFRFFRTIILARLLSPNDFGLFGIALLALTTIETFSRTGFRQALIQKKTDIKFYLDTAWTVGIIRGFLIATILFLVSPHAATFFNSPSADPIIKVIGLAFLLQPLANIAVIYFEKELEFQKYFAYQFAGTIANVIVALSAAIILRSVWALVLGVLAENFVKCIISYVIDPYRPRFYLHFQKIKELFDFGKWILGSSILFFFITQGDDIFVGKLLGAASLGLYQVAYRISNMPATEYSRLITRVTFPAYAKLQDDFTRLKGAYLKVLKLTTIFAIPTSGMIFILSPEFVRIFLGEKWMPMILAMQILALFGLIRAVGGTTQPVFASIGRPDIATKIQSGQLILLVILIYPFTSRWQIAGTALAVTVSAFILHSLAVTMILRKTKSDPKQPIQIILLPSMATLFMILSIFLTKNYLLSSVSLVTFLLLIGVGIFTYLVIIFLFDKLFNFGCKQLVLEQFKIIFQKHKTEVTEL